MKIRLSSLVITVGGLSAAVFFGLQRISTERVEIKEAPPSVELSTESIEEGEDPGRTMTPLPLAPRVLNRRLSNSRRGLTRICFWAAFILSRGDHRPPWRQSNRH